MTWRYAGLSLLLLGIVVARVLCEKIVAWRQSMSPIPPFTHLDDPESLLATGQQMPFVCADMWSLELISGVSDTLATELLERRASILQAARHAPPEVALQLARGVGAAKSRELAKFISMEEACAKRRAFDIFAPTDRPSAPSGARAPASRASQNELG